MNLQATLNEYKANFKKTAPAGVQQTMRQAAEELRAAASTYEKALEQLKLLDFKDVSDDEERRRQLADKVDHIAKLEEEAIVHIERAIDAME